MSQPTTLLGFLVLTALSFSVRAEDRPVTNNKVHKKEQQLEQEVKTERDRPQKKERAKAAAGRVEDGVRDFGRGLQGVMKEAGISDGPPAAAKKAEAKPEAKPATPAKAAATPAPAAASAPASKKAVKAKPVPAAAPAAPAAPAK
jgi:cytoskeletal protein RodZ